jgi:hypothetical protein
MRRQIFAFSASPLDQRDSPAYWLAALLLSSRLPWKAFFEVTLRTSCKEESVNLLLGIVRLIGSVPSIICSVDTSAHVGTWDDILRARPEERQASKVAFVAAFTVHLVAKHAPGKALKHFIDTTRCISFLKSLDADTLEDILLRFETVLTVLIPEVLTVPAFLSDTLAGRMLLVGSNTGLPAPAVTAEEANCRWILSHQTLVLVTIRECQVLEPLRYASSTVTHQGTSQEHGCWLDVYSENVDAESVPSLQVEYAHRLWARSTDLSLTDEQVDALVLLVLAFTTQRIISDRNHQPGPGIKAHQQKQKQAEDRWLGTPLQLSSFIRHVHARGDAESTRQDPVRYWCWLSSVYIISMSLHVSQAVFMLFDKPTFDWLLAKTTSTLMTLTLALPSGFLSHEPGLARHVIETRIEFSLFHDFTMQHVLDLATELPQATLGPKKAVASQGMDHAAIIKYFPPEPGPPTSESPTSTSRPLPKTRFYTYFEPVFLGVGASKWVLRATAFVCTAFDECTCLACSDFSSESLEPSGVLLSMDLALDVQTTTLVDLNGAFCDYCSMLEFLEKALDCLQTEVKTPVQYWLVGAALTGAKSGSRIRQLQERFWWTPILRLTRDLSAQLDFTCLKAVVRSDPLDLNNAAPMFGLYSKPASSIGTLVFPFLTSEEESALMLSEKVSFPRAILSASDDELRDSVQRENVSFTSTQVAGVHWDTQMIRSYSGPAYHLGTSLAKHVTPTTSTTAI